MSKNISNTVVVSKELWESIIEYLGQKEEREAINILVSIATEGVSKGGSIKDDKLPSSKLSYEEAMDVIQYYNSKKENRDDLTNEHEHEHEHEHEQQKIDNNKVVVSVDNNLKPKAPRIPREEFDSVTINFSIRCYHCGYVFGSNNQSTSCPECSTMRETSTSTSYGDKNLSAEEYYKTKTRQSGIRNPATDRKRTPSTKMMGARVEERRFG